MSIVDLHFHVKEQAQTAQVFFPSLQWMGMKLVDPVMICNMVRDISWYILISNDITWSYMISMLGYPSCLTNWLIKIPTVWLAQNPFLTQTIEF